MIDECRAGARAKMSDVRHWLETIGLAEYFDKFVENRITADVLPDLTERDLEKLSIPLGDRKKLLKAIASIHALGMGRMPAATTSLESDPGVLEETDTQTSNLAVRVERRQLTLMFVDLVGSTALSERLDLEDYRAVIQTLHETSAVIIHKHRGFIGQFQGDGVLAYFGYPRAEEDDAERAVAAGLSIVRAVAKIESEPGIFLQARVGIATGLVAVGDLTGEGFAQKSTVTGEAVNLAARLQSLTAPGTVVTSDVTRNLLGKQFVCEQLGIKPIKGLSHSVRIWQVREEQFLTSRFESQRRGHLTPFVGREDELLLLHRCWSAAKSGSGQMVLISGEPGIGKSRLAKEFCDQIASEQQPTHLHYQCLPNRRDSPFHPIIARFERVIGLGSGDSQTEKLDKLETWVGRELRETPTTTRIFAKLLSVPIDTQSDPLELAPKELKEATLEILLDHLSILLEKSPVLLLFEDLQWADPTTQDFLDTVSEWMIKRCLLLLCTCRPEYQSGRIGNEHNTYLNLNRLDDPHSAALVDRMLGGMELPHDVAEGILTKTDGVPLFLEELTKTVLESGSLRREGDVYRLDPASDALGVLPTTLRGSLLARLDRLPGAQHVAPLGAAIGRTFSYELLRQVTDSSDDELQRTMSQLIDAELLTQRGISSDVTYRFKHALVQDAAYETLPKGTRRMTHRRIAQALAKISPEVCINRPEILADHYARSDRPVEAYEFWHRAAIIASQQFANLEAIAHIKNALIANEHTETYEARISNEIQLREMLYVPLEVTNWGSEEIEANLVKLQKLREERGDTEELFSVLNGNCGDHVMAGRVSEARKIARKIVQVKNENLKPVAAVVGSRFLGICEFLSGNFSKAISYLEKTIDACNLVEREEVRKYYYADSVLMARSYIAWALVLSGEGEKAEDAIKIATQLIAKEVDAHSKTYALCILASVHQSADDPANSLQNSSAALALAREHKHRYWEAWAQIMKGWALTARGDHKRGIKELRSGIARYKRTGSIQMLPYAHTLLADAYHRAGDTFRALKVLQNLEKKPEFKEIRNVETLKLTLRNRMSEG